MKFKLRPIFKDISLTFLTQAIVLIAFFFIYWLIAKNFGPQGVGEYSLVKRVIGFLQPILILGLGVGIPRYIAISHSKEESSSYIKSGGLVIAVLTFIFLIFINMFKDNFAKIFFGTVNYANLVLPFSLFWAGLILHLLIYSYFRGRLLVKTFNTLQIINLAVVPIAILVLFKNITIERLITFIGIATFVIAIVFSLFFIKEILSPIKKWQFKDSLKELLRYSLPRVPADFALAGFFSLGPIFATHFTTIKEVGYLSVSQSLLSVAGGIVAPLGLILLPKISNLISQKREGEIKENLNYLIRAIIQLSTFILFQLIIFTDAIIKYWLGSDFINAIPVMRVVFCSIVFYLFYVAMRNILDAAKIKPLNTINLFISLGVFLGIGGILLFLIKIFSSIISLSMAFTFAMGCLGILTYISIRKIYPEKFKKDFNYLWIAVALNILLGGVAIFVKPFIISKLYYLISFEILIGTIYLSILWFLKMDWIKQISRSIFEKYA